MGKLTDNRGISFIQVIMASTAIAGLALVGLRLAQGQRNLVESVHSNRLSHYLFQEIEFLLKKDSICSSTFSGLNPSRAKVKKLKELIGTNRGNIESEYFPVKKGVDSNEGLYFDKLVSLLSYELTDSYEGTNIEKGLTGLKVELEVGGEVIDRVFLLKFTKNEAGNVARCRLFESDPLGSSGKWHQGRKGLQLVGPRVSIGASINRSRQKVESSGELKINSISTLPSCTSLNEGLLMHKSREGLKVCHNNLWIPFGEQRFKFEAPTSYILSLTQLGSDVKFTKKHRLCYISKLKKNSNSDGCQIRRISGGHESEYELKIFTSSDVTNSECEVSCVD